MSSKASIYRTTKMCGNCPFREDGKAIHLANGRIDEIKKDLLLGGSFNCHKTVYHLDNDMNPLPEEKRETLKMCYGAYRFLKKAEKPNQVMQVALRLLGED